jgi:cytochrome c553
MNKIFIKKILDLYSFEKDLNFIPTILEAKRNTYTDEDLRKIAKKYETKTDWKENESGSFSVAQKRSKEFFKDITSHMKRPVSKRAFTLEELRLRARKYKTKKEWRDKDPSSYVVAWRKGSDFFDEISSHMTSLGSRSKRLIYAFEFPDNHVYIGLTYDVTRRKGQHLDTAQEKKDEGKSTVFKYIQESGLEPEFKILSELIDVEESKKEEEKFIQYYKNKGWNILNRAKSGGVGGSYLVYTDEYLRNDAKKYNSKSEWQKNNINAYAAANKKDKDFYDEITSHMVRPTSHRLKYSDDLLRSIAKKYKTKKEWEQSDNSSLVIARKRGQKFFKDITSHMDVLQREKYTDQELRDIAKKYNTKTEWSKNNRAASLATYKRGLDFVKDITSHMDVLQREYTDEILRDIAKKYNTKSEWLKNDMAARNASYRRGLNFVKDITSHMGTLQRKKYTDQELRDIAKKYNTKSEWQKNDMDARNASYRRGLDFVKSITSHMNSK